jgi:hypothetical protein
MSAESAPVAVGAERGEHIAEINGVFGVSVEVRPKRQAWRGNAADHGAIPEDRKVKPRDGDGFAQSGVDASTIFAGERPGLPDPPQ